MFSSRRRSSNIGFAKVGSSSITGAFWCRKNYPEESDSSQGDTIKTSKKREHNGTWQHSIQVCGTDGKAILEMGPNLQSSELQRPTYPQRGQSQESGHQEDLDCQQGRDCMPRDENSTEARGADCGSVQ